LRSARECGAISELHDVRDWCEHSNCRGSCKVACKLQRKLRSGVRTGPSGESPVHHRNSFLRDKRRVKNPMEVNFLPRCLARRALRGDGDKRGAARGAAAAPLSPRGKRASRSNARHSPRLPSARRTGVVLKAELAVGLLNHAFLGVRRDAEHIVEVGRGGRDELRGRREQREERDAHRARAPRV
jgi:hypothetical protein